MEGYMRNYWIGFGGIKFKFRLSASAPLYEAHFPHAVGRVIFEPVYRYSAVNINRKIRSPLLGYRVRVEIDHIVIAEEDEEEIWEDFIDIMNQVEPPDGITTRFVTVIPEFDDTKDDEEHFQIFNCVMQSDISTQPPTHEQCFQSFGTLVFEKYDLIKDLPKTFRASEKIHIVDEEGDRIITDDTKAIIGY